MLPVHSPWSPTSFLAIVCENNTVYYHITIHMCQPLLTLAEKCIRPNVLGSRNNVRILSPIMFDI